MVFGMGSPKNCIVILISGLLLGLGFGCGVPDNTVRLKMAHGLSTTHPVHRAMEFMAKRAHELSDGTLMIEIYPSEQLGNQKEMLEKLQLGVLAMTKVSSSVLESFIDEYKVFAFPYLFRDSGHYWRVLDGEIGRRILMAGTSKNLRGLAYYDAGFRSFYTVKGAILNPGDLKGLKIRVQQSPMAMKMVDALGGSPTPVSWGELYTALQQGVVDGAENNPPSLYTANHFEVCKYYSLDEHTAVPDVILINTDIFSGLSEQHKQAITEAAAESSRYQRTLWEDFVRESMDKMTAAGLKVFHPDKALFKEKARSLWREFEGTPLGNLAKAIEKVE